MFDVNDVLENGFISFTAWGERDPTQLGPIEITSLIRPANNVTCEVISVNMRRLMMKVK
jgi:hypothetical protein